MDICWLLPSFALEVFFFILLLSERNLSVFFGMFRSLLCILAVEKLLIHYERFKDEWRTASQKVFDITELLEAILLETDMRTLLTSAQRVSRRWHALIQDSSALQMMLFFRPAQAKGAWESQRRKTNPLIKEFLWDGLFRRQPTRYYGELMRDFSRMHAKTERMYLRKQASWKRMLLHQPPTVRLGFVETNNPHFPNGNALVFSQVKLTPENDGDFVRLDTLYRGIKRGLLWPELEPLMFRPIPITQVLLRREQRDILSSKYLVENDVVFLVDRYDPLREERAAPSGQHEQFQCWINTLGPSQVVRKPSWELFF
ncbi:hypothetical protein ARAM_003392 [Aspergillus rambellii]|uniref:F-box domain-containing protein n=2 Tax=Aspergillus subgen. Nidulantes TaxID=2720870 RepID=A0A0F8V4W8_9EURO|nr:hypothetical protein ARAM_003392 [Aspergillus rambellii]